MNTEKKQFGSKRNISIDEAKTIVLENLIGKRDKFKGKRQPVNKNLPRILFVDFKNAFDSVSWDKLFKIVEERGILNQTELQILKFIYSNVFISNGKGKIIKISKGTPQGMSSSPILF